MISNAIQSALSGLKTSSMRFEEAAIQTVQSSAQIAQTPTSEAIVTSSFPAGGPALQNTSTLTQLKAEQPDLASSAVSMQEASFSYKASAKVLEVLNEMQGELFRKDV